jgi:histidinol dehydrogenase
VFERSLGAVLKIVKTQNIYIIMIISVIETTAGGGSNFLRIESLAKMSKERKRKLLLRSVTRMEGARPLIEDIMKEVQQKGDEALLRYTKRFDKVDLKPGSIRVSKAGIRKAYEEVKRQTPELVSKMKTTIDCVRAYHEGERDQLKMGLKRWDRKIRHASFEGLASMNVGQLRTPINRVGIYVPGGHAALFSTALMGITPAVVAGVPEIVVASPPSRNGDIDPKIIVAADLAGATTIIRAGGAQAIAAMAFGTKSVPKVSKIVGPGNIYVAAAKGYVASTGICAIDFLAGPSEILVVADDSVDMRWAARDMISQAEHDPDACAILVTNSMKVANGVQRKIQDIIHEDISKGGDEGRMAGIAKTSLSRFGAIVVTSNLEEAISFANEFAPEHIEIMTRHPKNWAKKVLNAGAIFVGDFSPVAIGDYVCPNHILPTGGAARYTSGINIDTFMKKPSISRVPEGLMKTFNILVGALSKAEGLYDQHGLSVKARLERKQPAYTQ